MTAFEFFMILHAIFFCSGVVGKNKLFCFIGLIYMLVAVICGLTGV